MIVLAFAGTGGFTGAEAAVGAGAAGLAAPGAGVAAAGGLGEFFSRASSVFLLLLSRE